MISTAAMGNGDTDDVELDVYGSVGVRQLAIGVNLRMRFVVHN
jgi:hypothetical protein